MARTETDILNDIETLSKLKIGSRVLYKSSEKKKKKNDNKTGFVTGFNKYEGRYGRDLKREYHNYSSVTIKLDDSGKCISASPRNLVILDSV